MLNANNNINNKDYYNMNCGSLGNVPKPLFLMPDILKTMC